MSVWNQLSGRILIQSLSDEANSYLKIVFHFWIAVICIVVHCFVELHYRAIGVIIDSSLPTLRAIVRLCLLNFNYYLLIKL